MEPPSGEDVEEEVPKPKRGRGAKRGAKTAAKKGTGRGRGKKKVVEEELESIEEQNTEDSEATENGSQVDFFLAYPNFRDTFLLEFRIYRATVFATSRKTSNLKYSRATFLDFDLWGRESGPRYRRCSPKTG